MTTTGVEGLDSSIHNTNLWLKELSAELHTENRREAYQILRGTLQALRDRIQLEEALDLGSQLPLVLRGAYFDGWKPSQNPQRWSTEEELLNAVRDRIGVSPAGSLDNDLRFAVQCALKVLKRHVTTGELMDVQNNLPKELAQYFAAA